VHAQHARAAAHAQASAKRSSGSTRAGGSGNSRTGSGNSRTGSGNSRSNASAARGKASAARSKASAARSKASTAASQNTSSQDAGDNDSGSSVREKITHVAVPAVTGALGVAGGMLLGRTALKRNRKVLGIPIPGMKVDMVNVSKQISDAGRQFGRLASEVQTAREKAEKISRAIG